MHEKTKTSSYVARQTPEEFQDPVLGYMQAIVLKTIADLGDEAFGYKVCDVLSQDGIKIDHSQVYTAIGKLERRRLISSGGSRKSNKGGPPQKMYKVTETGRQTLIMVIAHHVSVAAYLQK